MEKPRWNDSAGDNGLKGVEALRKNNGKNVFQRVKYILVGLAVFAIAIAFLIVDRFEEYVAGRLEKKQYIQDEMETLAREAYLAAENRRRADIYSEKFFNTPILLQDGTFINKIPFAAGISQTDNTTRTIIEVASQPGDMSAVFNSIMSSSTDPLEIHLDEGIYHLHSDVYIRSRATIRGKGMRKSVLYLHGNAEIKMSGYKREAIPLGYSVSNGVDFIVIDDAESKGFVTGDPIKIGLSLPDEVIVYDEVFGGGNYLWRHRGQIVIVEEVINEGIRISPEIILNYPEEYNPYVQQIEPVRFSGVEDLTIKKTFHAHPTHSLNIKAAINCWARNVEFSHSRKSHVWATYSKNLEFTGNYFHHGWRYCGEDGLYGYGVSLANSTSDSLVSDNVFKMLRHSMILSRGASGNVISYNYSTGVNPQQDLKGSADMDVHGYYSGANLIEGNDIYFAHSSAWYGHAGPLIIIFRNRVKGEGILISYSNFPVVAGNLVIHGSIYVSRNSLGAQILENISSDKGKSARDFISDVCIRIRDDLKGIILPPSLYLEQKPSFLEDSNWPPFGPDVGAMKQLPAQNRYEGIYSKWPVRFMKQSKAACQKNHNPAAK